MTGKGYACIFRESGVRFTRRMRLPPLPLKRDY